ncbi:MAG: hypothetical protein MK066_08450 [Crocinitomicaceae bacterium]|nr:hypothetical protein [Crocinitomicaceae bacterium]
MSNLINNLGFGGQFNIKANLSVSELMNHDMIYVYHHLTEGAVVELKRYSENIEGDPIFKVYYKAFLLGVVTVSGIIKSFYSSERSIIAEVSAVSKDKYMPINKLDIQLRVQSFKKAS